MTIRLKALYAPLPHARSWWLVLFFLSMASMADVAGSPTFGMPASLQWTFTVLTASLKASLLIWIAGWIWSRRFLSWMLYPLGLLYLLGASVNFGAYLFYGFGISRKLISILAQTSPRETSEFIPDIIANIHTLFTLPSTYIFILVAVVVSVIYIKLPKRVAVAATLALSTGGAAAYTWLALNFTSGRSSIALCVRTSKYIADQKRSDRQLRQLIEKKIPFPDAEKVNSLRLASDVILIIGESANRPNLSIYGFAIEDTPMMQRMKDSLFVFTDAIASSQLTINNLERILTFKPDDLKEGDWWEYPTLTDLFNAAGYTTYWLSNQERTGEWGNSAGVLASSATYTKYVGMDFIQDSMLADGTSDEALLPELRKALTDTSSYRLIMLHLQGSHTLYSRRYPSERAKYSASDVLRSMKKKRPWLNEEGARLLAEYTNSILFTDSIWGVAARLTADNPRPALLIYLSDHGENVATDGSNGRGRTSRSVEVPFVVYANASFRRANPAIIEKLERGCGRAFSTAATIHLLMTLTGTSYPYYDPGADPLSDGWQRRVRNVDEQPWERITPGSTAR